MPEETGDRRQEAGGGPHSLLAVFAHPDDESLACGGLLAWCAALGVRVSLLSVTHGEHGQDADSRTPAGPDVRETELRDAAGVLGIAEVTILDHADGMLPWVEAGQLEADIRAVIRRTAPDVVITFGEDGLYWHPDHIAVHERTTAAVAALLALAGFVDADIAVTDLCAVEFFDSGLGLFIRAELDEGKAS